MTITHFCRTCRYLLEEQEVEESGGSCARCGSDDVLKLPKSFVLKPGESREVTE